MTKLTNSTFKMKKQYKRLLANYKDKELRNYMKKLFIQAQIIAEKSEYVVFK